MSEAEVQDLHDQLRLLRGKLPDFLQAVTRLDDAKDTRTAFYNVAQSLNSWMQESSQFLQKYQTLKEQIGEVKAEEPPKKEELAEFNGFNGIDSGLDSGMDSGMGGFETEFFDLT